MSYKNIEEDIYLSRRYDEWELEDQTRAFIARLHEYSSREGFGGISWIIGQIESGKSVLASMLANQLLLSAIDIRKVPLYQAPSKLLREIQRAIPKDIFDKDHFRIIERLSEVEPFDVFFIDEGYLSADAKDALTKQSKNFIQSLVTLRHSSVFSILNSQDDGILKRYRTKAQFKFYKSLTDGFIEENPIDKFAKKHAELIPILKQKETLFRITHPRFTNGYPRIRVGKLVMDYHDYCPWWNEEISRNFEGETFDAMLRRTEKIKDRSENLIKLLASKFHDKITIAIARGFLWDNYPELLIEFEDHLKYIVNAIKSRYKLEEFERLRYKRKEKEEEEEDDDNDTPSSHYVDKIYLPEVNRTISFQDFLLNFYRINLKTLPAKEREYHSLIMWDWANGKSQADIMDDRGGSPNTINDIIKKYRSGIKLSNDYHRVAFALEYYIALYTDGIRQGGQSQPDLMYYQNHDKLGPGEVKLIETKSNRIRFYINSRNSDHHSLTPSYEYCLNHGLKCFPLFYFWPKWGITPIMIPVNLPEGSSQYENSFFVEKASYEEYELNFKLFNKFTFFLAPPRQ